MDSDRWREIERLCHSALQFEKEKRRAYLTEACAGDESLRNEVEALLANLTEAKGFMKDPAMEAAAKALAQDQKNMPAKDLTGQCIAHYRIEEKIGEGGMGVVYQAQDTRLNRQVAIKVLPDEFVRDRERLARFEREAKTLATLNHPNIAEVFGLEESEGTPCLVMELVEGKTLGERLKKGRIPLDETLGVCSQIAAGLEAAHERGIIHRDLKPSNVNITLEGNVKILDFGLAKTVLPQTSSDAESPLASESMTETGVILGTAGYMSPEQATGKPVDKRTDIWAFGCVLYECFTGSRAFRGETITEIVASILKGDPDWTLLPADTPPFVRRVLKQCLQKDPKLRLHDIADFRVQMHDVKPPVLTARVRRFSPVQIITMSAVAAAAFLVGLFVKTIFGPAGSRLSDGVERTYVRLEPGLWLDGWRRSAPLGFEHPTRTAMALSSEGRFVVYAAIKDNPGVQDHPQLYLRQLDRLEAKPIAGTEGGVCPFLSPDDQWVGFWAGGKLMKVSVEGGVAAVLCDAAPPMGVSWGTDDQIVFSSLRGIPNGLQTVSGREGGNSRQLTIPDPSKGERSHRLPHWLPGGRAILFTITKDGWDMNPRVAVLEVASGKYSILLEDAADARILGTRHLAFLRRGTLMVVPFDLERLSVTGPQIPAIEGISQALNTGLSSLFTAAGQFAVSGSGSLIYAPGGILPDHQHALVWVDQKGNATPVSQLKAPFISPRLSPDGSRIVYWTLAREWQAWIYDLSRDTNTKITFEGKANYPIWTPDGRSVVLGWWDAAPSNIWCKPSDGGSPMERLTRKETFQVPGSFSPDGEILAFAEQALPAVTMDIMLLHMRERRATPFANSRFNETYPEFSPDGRWLAYVSDLSGSPEVYVQRFPGPAGTSQVSIRGGQEPLWSPDGKQLFYRSRDQVWAIDVPTSADFIAGRPRLLFENSEYGREASPIRNWDISRDGQQFLMVKLEQRRARPITEMNFVRNWVQEVKHLCSAGGRQ